VGSRGQNFGKSKRLSRTMSEGKKDADGDVAGGGGWVLHLRGDSHRKKYEDQGVQERVTSQLGICIEKKRQRRDCLVSLGRGENPKKKR